MPKTGTSAIQYVLQEHDNSVVIYPKGGLWAGGSQRNLIFNFHRDVPRAFAEQPLCHRTVSSEAVTSSMAFNRMGSSCGRLFA
jgi:hypothetical protein